MMYISGGFSFFMARGFEGTDHVWLVMMKTMHALTRWAAGVLDPLLHKEPLSVNTGAPPR